jgi:hypothetical protein
MCVYVTQDFSSRLHSLSGVYHIPHCRGVYHIPHCRGIECVTCCLPITSVIQRYRGIEDEERFISSTSSLPSCDRHLHIVLNEEHAFWKRRKRHKNKSAFTSDSFAINIHQRQHKQSSFAYALHTCLQRERDVKVVTLTLSHSDTHSHFQRVLLLTPHLLCFYPPILSSIFDLFFCTISNIERERE